MFGYTLIKTSELERLRAQNKKLSTWSKELTYRWIGECDKETIVAHIMALPPDLIRKNYSKILGVINTLIEEDCNGK